MSAPFPVLVTDLDGTLLDHDTYSFRPALPAIRSLQSRKIPIVFCTSKTREETIVLQETLGISDPFIVENGGAVHFKKGLFKGNEESMEQDGEWCQISLGVPHSQLASCLSRIKALVPGRIIGFSDMTAEEIAEDCGLSLSEARRAKCREYDEPFRILGERATVLERIVPVIEELGLKVTQGGRYFHLSGNSDKGQAVACLRKLYQSSHAQVYLAGIGDSLNDLPMLEAVDRPMLVARPDGGHLFDLERRFPKARRLDGAGPVGWCEGVLDLVHEWDGTRDA